MQLALRDFFRLDDQHPFTGRHMLAVVCTFFGVVIAVNVVMAIAATGTFPGLVVANSYVASQGYNELLAAARAQAAGSDSIRCVTACAGSTRAGPRRTTAHTPGRDDSR